MVMKLLYGRRDMRWIIWMNDEKRLLNEYKYKVKVISIYLLVMVNKDFERWYGNFIIRFGGIV